MIRLNKFLAQCGVASRRWADELIAAGKVTIDGRPAALGARVNPDSQTIRADGVVLAFPRQAHTMLVLNKPAGVVTTMHDEKGRKTVADLLPAAQRRLFPVGRLDAQTTGLLLVTSDGELARLLTHPSNQIPRRYEVVVQGELHAASIRRLRARNVRRLSRGRHGFALELSEGKNRQVRRMCSAEGLQVVALRRVRFGPVALGDLKPGCLRPLSRGEMQALAALQREKKFAKDPRNN